MDKAVSNSDVSDVSDNASKTLSSSRTTLENSTEISDVLPSIPLNVFPHKYCTAITEISNALCVPIEIPALAFLVLSGACIGRTRGIQAKRTWIEHANLYCAVVAGSGTGKSPAIKQIFKHIWTAEQQWHQDKNDNKKSTHHARQVIVDDATIESLTYVLENNPRGVLWYRDELAGLFLDFDKYSGKDGATKQRLMSAYNSEPWVINRVDEGKNKHIEHATLSIFGSIQPKQIQNIFKKDDIASGFIPRFMFVFANTDYPITWTDSEVREVSEKVLSELVYKLLSLDMIKDSPVIFTLSKEAKKAFASWYDRTIHSAYYGDDQELSISLTKKMHSHCLRIALILHVIDLVEKNKSDEMLVSADTINNAIELVRCLHIHQLYVLNQILCPDTVQYTSIQLKTIHAVIELQKEIGFGFLETARITEIMNKNIGSTFKLDVKAVGKILNTLGLHAKRSSDGKKRGYCISEDQLEKFYTYIYPDVKHVRNVK